MAIDLATMRAPNTRTNWPSDKTVAEFPLTGPQVKPPNIAAANVYPIPAVLDAIADGLEDTGLPETEEVWQFAYRITGATADATDGYLILWFYNYWTGQFYASTKIWLVGVDNISGARGNIAQLPGVLGCSHVGVQAVGLAAGDTVHILHSIA